MSPALFLRATLPLQQNVPLTADSPDRKRGANLRFWHGSCCTLGKLPLRADRAQRRHGSVRLADQALPQPARLGGERERARAQASGPPAEPETQQVGRESHDHETPMCDSL
jgi:hypothetical protein